MYLKRYIFFVLDGTTRGSYWMEIFASHSNSVWINSIETTLKISWEFVESFFHTQMKSDCNCKKGVHLLLNADVTTFWAIWLVPYMSNRARPRLSNWKSAIEIQAIKQHCEYFSCKYSILKKWVCEFDISILLGFSFYFETRKYSLHGYMLGVLAHKTAGDRHWKAEETLDWVLIYIALLRLA